MSRSPCTSAAQLPPSEPVNMCLRVLCAAGESRTSAVDKAGASSIIKAAFSNVPLKPQKQRPPHPVGTHMQHSSQFLTTLQFCNSFSEPLEIEPVSMEDFDRALGNFPDDVLSQMHMVRDVASGQLG